MINQVLETIKKYKLLKSGDRVLIALSGGPDSMCLLWILKELKNTYSLELRIAHLNHCLRKEATREADFVKEMASKVGIPYWIEKRDVKRYIKDHKVSLEEGAREVRYAFLEEALQKFGMNKIAVGHTASDEIETLILRITRGTGLKGLSLIPPARGKIIRPLIESERGDILKFIETQKIPYQVDRSNYDLSYTRNFVRHNIVPVLVSFAPDLAKKVMRLREILECDEEVLDRITQEELKSITIGNENGKVLNLAKFSANELPIKRRIIRKVVEELGYGSPSFGQIENALNYIDKRNPESPFDLQGVKIEKSYGKLLMTRMVPVFTPLSAKDKPRCYSDLSANSAVATLPVPGEVEVDGLKIKSRIMECNPDPELVSGGDFATYSGETQKFNFNNPARVYFDLAKVREPLLIRGRQEGDIMEYKTQPRLAELGGVGDFATTPLLHSKKKLKNVFIDDKIPRANRAKIPLLVDQDGILWIVGKRRANRALIGEHTTRVLEVWTEKG